MINTLYISSGGRCPMANVIKKRSIPSELAQKMVDQAVAKAREIGVAENVAILDDGGNLKAFGRMDGAPILSIEIAQNKAYTALFGVSTQDFFNFIQRDPSLLAGLPTLARVAAYGGGFPLKGDGEIVGAIGVTGAPQVKKDIDLAKAALAPGPDKGPAEVDVLGFWLGGFVAQELTLHTPALVRRLVLVGTGPRGGEGMASRTPEAQAVFGATYANPDDVWLGVFFTPSAASQAAGRA